MLTKVFTTGKEFLLVAFMVGLFAGCGNACKDLANHICDCQPTRGKKDRCQNSVSIANSNASLSSEQQDLCSSILDSGACTCQALQNGDLAACGLARDPLDSP